jgi:PhnB protein
LANITDWERAGAAPRFLIESPNPAPKDANEMSGSMQGSQTGKSTAKTKPSVQKVPSQYHTVTPYLVLDNATKVVDFLTKAFDAKTQIKMDAPGGKIGHAELKIGDSPIMVADAMMDMKPMQFNLYVYVEDADATFKKALQAGGTSVKEPMDQFYGDRAGCVKDPSGNTWWIATHIEDVPSDELKRRQRDMVAKLHKQ